LKNWNEIGKKQSWPEVVSRNFSSGIEEINGRTVSRADVPAKGRNRHLRNKVRSATGALINFLGGTKKKEMLRGWLKA
jgi:hypothetical protein